ncbi:hypothetical protein QYF36_012568 [Acer negundo]|nr:hypothetical protein QYF36_012568 [Acer negundo]
MKKSSMKTVPNGSIPSMRIEKIGFIVHIPGLFWDLPRDFVRLHSILDRWLLELDVARGPKNETDESTTLLIDERLNELKTTSGDSASRRRPAEDDRSTMTDER